MGKSRSSKKYANKYKCSYTGWWVLVILIIFHVLHKNMVLQMLPHSTGDHSKVICAKIFPQNLSQLMPAFINNFTQLLSLTLCPRQTISLVSVLLKEAVFRIGVLSIWIQKVNIRLPNKSDIKANIPNLISQSNWTSPNGSKTTNWWATNMDPSSPRHDRG